MVFMASRVLRFSWTLAHLFWIFFGDDGSFRVGVVGDEIVFELVGDDLVGMLRDHVEEFGVGFVGERVATRFDDQSGIEITVGKVAFDVDRSGSGRSAST